MKDRVSITMLDDGVADVRLIRTDKMNALDNLMFATTAGGAQRGRRGDELFAHAPGPASDAVGQCICTKSCKND